VSKKHAMQFLEKHTLQSRVTLANPSSLEVYSLFRGARLNLDFNLRSSRTGIVSETSKNRR
jgi:hypothetical protein